MLDGSTYVNFNYVATPGPCSVVFVSRGCVWCGISECIHISALLPSLPPATIRNGLKIFVWCLAYDHCLSEGLVQ
jgi:hypothetical protein